METITTITGQTVVLTKVEQARLTYLTNQVRDVLTLDYRGKMGVDIYERDSLGNINYSIWFQLTYFRPRYFKYWEYMDAVQKAQASGEVVKKEDYISPDTIVKIGNLNCMVGDYFALHTTLNFLVRAFKSKSDQTKMRTLIDLHLFLNFYANRPFYVRETYAKTLANDGNPLIEWSNNVNYPYIHSHFLLEETNLLNDYPMEYAEKWKEFKEPTKEEIVKCPKVHITYGTEDQKNSFSEKE